MTVPRHRPPALDAIGPPRASAHRASFDARLVPASPAPATPASSSSAASRANSARSFLGGFSDVRRLVVSPICSVRHDVCLTRVSHAALPHSLPLYSAPTELLRENQPSSRCVVSCRHVSLCNTHSPSPAARHHHQRVLFGVCRPPRLRPTQHHGPHIPGTKDGQQSTYHFYCQWIQC